MKVIIIEDEAIAAERLENQLNSLDTSMEVLGRAGSIKDAIALLNQSKPDLVFLDIQLSDGLCFQIFDWVLPKWPVIFTTAYDQYAIDAFKLHSIAYLLKPIKKDQLAAALLKYHQLRQLYQSDIDSLTQELVDQEKTYKKRFLVEIGAKIKTIETGEIAYFFAMDKSVFLVMKTGQKLPIDYTLDKLENLLDPATFFRINRKYFIQMNAITSMTNYSRKRMKVTLDPPVQDIESTLVSIEKAKSFREWLDS